MGINCSVNRHIVNKATHSQMRMLTEGFTPVTLSLDELQQEILAGHAFTPAVLTPNANGSYRRRNEAFGSANTVWIDIDNSVKLPGKGNKRRRTEKEGYTSIEDFLRDGFFQHYGLLTYTTHSHTEDWHRFRAIFSLPEEVTDPSVYQRIIRAFLRRFDADISCVDQCRVFYGNTNAEIIAIGKQLTPLALEFIDTHTEAVEREEKSFTRATSAGESGQVTEASAREMLSHIPPQGEYTHWVKIISAVASKFDEATAVRLIEEWSPGSSGEVAYKVRHRMQRVNFGTLVYYAKMCGWEPPKGFYSTVKTDGKPKKFMNTEYGNAERLVAKYGEKIRYEKGSGQWYIYDDRRFKRDEVGKIEQMAKRVVRDIYKEAKEMEDEDERKETAKWAASSESRNKISATIALAGTEPGVGIPQDYFDKNPLLLNLKNGVFNLDTWELLYHSHEQRITQATEISYEADAECPRWEAFLDTVFDKNEDMVEFIQRAVGYSLSGLTSEQCLFFCYGTGKNGKSVFFEVMKMLFCDYYQKAPTEMLLAKKNDGGASNDIARLRSARMVVATELPANKRFDESKIKDLTGQETITARFLYGEFFEFYPTHKLWISGNHKPIITGTDEGIWRRINLIPFTIMIPPERRRPMEELLGEFRAELSGILQWALEGFYFYRTDGGLKTPQQVIDATNDFRSDMDVIGGFIEQEIETEREAATPFTEVYARYAEWCSENGEYVQKARTFNQQMRERGYEGFLNSKPKTYHWRGIKLINPQKSSLF